MDFKVNSDGVHVGDRIRFTPENTVAGWWKVVDRDTRYIVAIAQRPFKPKGEWLYTVVDLTGWQNRKYNGVGNGVVRSSLDTLGGGWEIGPNGEGAEQILPALRDGEWGLSYRRLAKVWSIEKRQPAMRLRREAVR